VKAEKKLFGDASLMAIEGRVDQQTAASFQEALLVAIGEADAGVVLDLAAVEYISSVGLRALMIGAKESKANGKEIVVCGLQPMVQEVFQISRFDKVIKTFDTTHAALAAISEQAADAYGGA
jgi:anti-anti-sigma factor